jgi:NADPH:quinone reductase-like Zn-dependent oxidoreductase
MKAITYERYGDESVLTYTDMPEPKLGPDSVLARARVAGVNPVDVGIRAGYLDEMFDTYFPVIPGWDVAGTVERVGEGVDEFAPATTSSGTYARTSCTAARTPNWSRRLSVRSRASPPPRVGSKRRACRSPVSRPIRLLRGRCT